MLLGRPLFPYIFGWYVVYFPVFLFQEVLSQFNHIFSHLLGHAGIGRLSLGALKHRSHWMMRKSWRFRFLPIFQWCQRHAATRIPKNTPLKMRPKKKQHSLLNKKVIAIQTLNISCHTKVPSFWRGDIFDELLFCENETWSFLPAGTKILVVLRCCNFQHQAISNHPTSMSSNMFNSKPPRHLQQSAFKYDLISLYSSCLSS